MTERWIAWFDEVGLADLALVGGKNASLGELRQALTPRGVRVPNGFAVTADAYRTFLSAGGLTGEIAATLAGLQITDLAGLQARGRRLRAAILGTTLPPALAEAIRAAYRRLEAEYGPHCDVAVRSSATAEDLPEASFAGHRSVRLFAAARCGGSTYRRRVLWPQPKRPEFSALC